MTDSMTKRAAQLEEDGDRSEENSIDDSDDDKNSKHGMSETAGTDEDDSDLDHQSDSDVASHEGDASDHLTKKNNKIHHKLSLEQTERDFNRVLRKRGVVFISRVPPRMTPTKLKRLLSNHFPTRKNSKEDDVTRIYLVEEDYSVRKRRRKMGGNGSKRYIEGWIEFRDKKMAKYIAAALNNTAISNFKRDVHYGDLWNLKYLRKFSWSHLTEKVAYERRVREQKLRLETLQARKETASYKQLVEAGQKIDYIQQRKERKLKTQQQQQLASTSHEVGGDRKRSNVEDEGNTRKRFKPVSQVKPIDDFEGAAAKSLKDKGTLLKTLV
jgi:ESF2/ABP1 family protein